MYSFKKCLLLLVCALPIAVVQAGDKEDLSKALNKLMPGAKVTSIEKTPITGLFEVSYGPTVYYFNKDASLMLQGDMIDLKTRDNLTEKKRSMARAELIKSEDEKSMIIFAAKDEKYKVTVFTDVDCFYCAKLHKDVKAYNDAGITIRYMAYPRAGIGSPSYNKAVSAWCNKDRKKALTAAKAGKEIESKTCDNPVAHHFELGQLLGIRGTPAIFVADGTMLPGYVPASQLKQMLDKNSF